MNPPVGDNADDVTLADVTAMIAELPDPEIPVLTIEDLGILRSVQELPDGGFQVDITPTYSGCPAMQAIEESIMEKLATAGIQPVVVRLVLSPAWTTDWISERGKCRMKAYGIAPPVKLEKQHLHDPSVISVSVPLFADTGSVVRCPRCDSPDTERVSAFGSTACKEHWLCLRCKEPFDHFKCH